MRKLFITLTTLTLLFVFTSSKVDAAYTCLGGGDHSGADWTPATDCAGGIAGVHTNIGTLTVSTGTTATVQAYSGGNYGSVDISATTVDILGTGIITADSKGYAGGGVSSSGQGPGGGTSGFGNIATSGGGHGGWGKSGSGSCCGVQNGSLTAPVSMGSGGGGGGSAGVGGTGAGAIKITATGTMTIAGTITAGGGNGGSGCCGNGAGGGAGGSIYLTAATITGGGTIRANGGAGGIAAAGGGGGGRIAMYYSSTNSFSGTAQANYGSNGSDVGYNQSYGTVFIEDSTNHDILIPSQNGRWSASDRASWEFRDLTINAGMMFLATGSTLFTVTSTRTTTITSSAITIYTVGSYSTNSNGKGVYFSLTGNVTIPANTTINADAFGYAGGGTSTGGSGSGGGGSGFGNHLGGGGGHGGAGGTVYFGGGGTYDSATAPSDLGSGGGGGGSGGSGGSGGGAVRIGASGTLTISGIVTAGGSNGTNVCCGNAGGGGAGGSIYITASTIAGNGTIRANGGAGGSSAGQAGGGGGGRISLIYGISSSFSGSTSAAAGAAGSPGTGSISGPTNEISPNTPTSLGAAASINGSYSNDTTTTMSFSLSDVDTNQTLRYRIQISANSNYSSPVVDYTSALAAQGSASFTVGQAAGSGSYTTGSAGQTLSEGNYFWRVQAIDDIGAVSLYANAGDCAYVSTCDSSGMDNQLTFVDNATTATGKYGSALSLDGTDDRATLDRTTSLPGSSTGQNEISIVAWVNATTLGSTKRNIISRGDTPTQSWAIYNTSSSAGKLSFTADGGTNIGLSSTTLVTSTWYQVVMVVENSTTKLYINGELDASTNFNGTLPDTGGVAIGADASGTNAWLGKIDEVRIYNRTLKINDVKALYNWAPAPAGYWPFDTDTATASNDVSGYANSGVATATTTIPGKFGKAHGFNGTTSKIAVTNGITGIQTVSFWANPTTTTATLLGLTSTAYISASSGTISATGFTSPTIYVNGAVSSTLVANTWQYITVTTATPITATAITFGYGNGVYYSGKLDDIKLYKYARTTKQIISDMNAGHPNVGSPVGSAVGQWKFDEGVDNTCSGGANDACNSGSGGISLDGAQSGMAVPATAASGWTSSGKFNKALNFDGTDDVATVTNSSPIDFDTGLNTGVTFSAWINPDTVGEGSAGEIFRKSATTFCKLGGSTPFNLSCSLDLGTDATVTVSSVIPASTWTHVAMVWTDDADDEINVYVNGILRGTSTNGVGPNTADSSNLLIGGGTSNNFDGKIDEFKVYNYELSADEIKVDYNRGLSIAMGVEDTGTKLTDGAGNPPIAYWSFEEKTGGTAHDFIGNNYTGTWNGTNSHWSVGKFGTAGKFDGTSSSYVEVPSNSTLNITAAAFTIEGWFKRTGSTSIAGDTNLPIFSQGNSATTYSVIVLLTNAGVINFSMYDGTNNPGVNSTSTITLNQWNHVSAVYNGSNLLIYVNGRLENSASKGAFTNPSYLDEAEIGAWANDLNGRGHFNGLIDEVKVYNYARSASQVAFDYNRGAPVAWYKFDECQGSTAYDSAPNANGGFNGSNGTITPGGSGNTTAGSCNSGVSTEMWDDGTTGKFNSSLGFDGIDDYVTITSNETLKQANDFSVSAWFKSAGVSGASDDYIISKGTFTSANYFIYLLGTTGYITGGYYDGSTWVQPIGTTNLGDNAWHHVVLTKSSGVATLYVDGKSIGRASGGSTATTGSSALIIGSEGSGGNNGPIDEVRIYNYALSVTQVKEIFNNGFSVFFGPATGSP